MAEGCRGRGCQAQTICCCCSEISLNTFPLMALQNEAVKTKPDGKGKEKLLKKGKQNPKMSDSVREMGF